jgi:hypothetical protein
LDDNHKEKLESLKREAQVAQRMSLIASFSGIIAIPFAFLGILLDNTVLSAASLCWLVSHFIGYITRILQEEQKQLATRLSSIESSVASREQVESASLSHRASWN